LNGTSAQSPPAAQPPQGSRGLLVSFLWLVMNLIFQRITSHINIGEIYSYVW